MSWWMRRRAARARAGDRSASASVSRKLPPTIQNESTSPAADCSTISARRPAAAAAGPGNPRRRPPRRGRRIDRRHAADFGAALHAGVAADRHEPAVRPSGQPAREPDVDQRVDRVDAVRVLRQPHRPDEDRVRPLDQQPRERPHRCPRTRRSRARASAQSRRKRRRRAPPRTRRCASRTNVVVDAAASRSSARSTPTRNARSPPVCTWNQ